MKCSKPSSGKPHLAAVFQPHVAGARAEAKAGRPCAEAGSSWAGSSQVSSIALQEPHAATDGRMSRVGLRSKPGSHAKTGTEHLFHSVHPYDFTALLPESYAGCSQIAAGIVNSSLPPVFLSLHPWKHSQSPLRAQGMAQGLAAVMTCLPLYIKGPGWPNVLVICPQYPLLQMRVTVIAITVIVIPVMVIVIVIFATIVFLVWSLHGTAD